jgi:hypothetical protein
MVTPDYVSLLWHLLISTRSQKEDFCTTVCRNLKTEPLTLKVCKVYRREGNNVGKVATDSNLTIGKQFVEVVTWFWECQLVPTNGNKLCRSILVSQT